MSALDHILFGAVTAFALSACRFINRDISVAGDFLAVAFPLGAFLFMLIPVKVLARIKSNARIRAAMLRPGNRAAPGVGA